MGAVCRMHGARHKSSIKRGEEHPNYRHGMETISSKLTRSKKLAELREIEDDLIARGLIEVQTDDGKKAGH